MKISAQRPARLIINPASGHHGGKELFHQISAQLKRFGLDADPCLTVAPGQAQELARQAVEAGYDTILIYGGDGTICEVVNGVFPAEVKLGLIPGGKGNDLARYLGIPAKLEQACEVIGRGYSRKLDLARAGARLFCTVAGIGLPSQVARRINQGACGKIAYLYGAILEIFKFSPFWIRIEYPEGIYQGEIVLAAVGNTSYFGGGFKITPRACAEDGLLDVCVVEPAAKSSLICRLPKVFTGGHLHYPFVKYWQTSQVYLSSRQSVEIFADGEYFQTLPIKINVEPRAVNFIVSA